MTGVQQFLLVELFISGLIATAWVARGYSGEPLWWAPYGIIVDAVCLWLMWGMDSTRPWQFWLMAFIYFAGIFVNVYHFAAQKIITYRHGERAGGAVGIFIFIVLQMWLVVNIA